jgi:predicted nucleotidyltransferase
MDKNRILAILRSHAPELQAAGIAHLRLFGSVARGEANPQSDIDLMADFSPDLRVSLMTLSGLRLQLCDLLGTEVDLSPASAMKEPVRANADREAVHVF